MINWWTTGNQIISSVLSNPFQFGDYLELEDIKALGQSCITTSAICKWIIKSVHEAEQAKISTLPTVSHQY